MKGAFNNGKSEEPKNPEDEVDEEKFNFAAEVAVKEPTPKVVVVVTESEKDGKGTEKSKDGNGAEKTGESEGLETVATSARDIERDIMELD